MNNQFNKNVLYIALVVTHELTVWQWLRTIFTQSWVFVKILLSNIAFQALISLTFPFLFVSMVLKFSCCALHRNKRQKWWFIYHYWLKVDKLIAFTRSSTQTTVLQNQVLLFNNWGLSRFTANKKCTCIKMFMFNLSDFAGSMSSSHSNICKSWAGIIWKSSSHLK